MTETTDIQPIDENKLIAERREKLKALRGQGVAFPNDFKMDSFAGDLQAEFADVEKWTAEAIEERRWLRSLVEAFAKSGATDDE